MSRQKPAETAGVRALVLDDPDDRKGRLKKVGGSQSDHWNDTLAHQVFNALWLKHSDSATQENQLKASLGALCGISPREMNWRA
jgi:hypothetical protein